MRRLDGALIMRAAWQAGSAGRCDWAFSCRGKARRIIPHIRSD